MSVESAPRTAKETNANYIDPQKKLEVEFFREAINDPTYLPFRSVINSAFPEEYADSKQAWQKYTDDENYPKYEIFTVEYIEQLAATLHDTALRLGHSPTRPLRVLEVCAGNGRLTHFLNEEIDRKYPGLINVFAIDSGRLEIAPTFPVENMSHKDALDTYQPDVVINSWMPPNEDLSQDFRDTPSVQEYILIGEPDLCGKDWETWGVDLGITSHSDRTPTPPYAKDGFKIDSDNDFFSDVQLCRTDEPWTDYSRSMTIRFSRKD